MTSWQSGHAVAPKSKAAMVAALQNVGRTVASAKRAGRNTLDWTDEKGVRHIRLHQTDILTFRPRGGFTVDTGGWNTHTTRARINEFLPSGWKVSTSRGVVSLRNYETGTETPFRQIVTVDAKGNVRSDVTPASIAKAAKALDAYMKAWKAKGLPSAEESGGDPWIFTAGKVGAHIMRDWMRSRYVFRKLYVLALQFAGLQDAGIACHLHAIDRRGGKLDRIDIGRIRRYVRACLGGAA